MPWLHLSLGHLRSYTVLLMTGKDKGDMTHAAGIMKLLKIILSLIFF
jgi:hypothetical protein